MSRTTVHLAQRQHVPAIADLNLAAYREYATELTPADWAAMQAHLRAMATPAPPQIGLVSAIASELVGSVVYCPPGHSLAPIPSDWASILLLAVSPQHRRQGIGRSLIHACIQQAEAAGAGTIGLFTSETMTGACRLYEAFGFNRDGEIPPRRGWRYWRYRLDLPPGSDGATAPIQVHPLFFQPET